MKVKTKFLVIRYKDEIIDVKHIQDSYEYVVIAIPSDYLTDEDIIDYYKEISTEKEFLAQKIREVRENGELVDEQEAKDFVQEFSKVSIRIEEKNIIIK